MIDITVLRSDLDLVRRTVQQRGADVDVELAVLALLENHVQPDGSVRIPTALRPYLSGQELIEPKPGYAPGTPCACLW